MRSDHELKIVALQSMANWMETGNPHLSANDAIQQKKFELLRPLEESQREDVVRLRQLAKLIMDRFVERR